MKARAILVLLIAVVPPFANVGGWPWDHDEVATLLELGIRPRPASLAGMTQLDRLPLLLPVWYTAQRLFLTVLPVDEFGCRILSALCGSFTVVSLFGIGARWRGPNYGFAIALLVGFNQSFVWLVQQSRFYSMAMMFMVWTFAAIGYKTDRRVLSTVFAAVLSLLAVFSHNLTAVMFGIGFIAALLGLSAGVVPKWVCIRSGATAVVSTVAYLTYLRPIMAGWISGDTGGTNELISFAAQIGIPTLSLAALGIGLSLRGRQSELVLWWDIVMVGSLLFVFLAPWMLGAWNPRYAFFFMLPCWVMAAYAVNEVAARLSGGWRRFVWFAFVGSLLMPKFASHYVDGSRHDFRAAAEIVRSSSSPGEPIVCNWPTTLNYYLGRSEPEVVVDWQKRTPLPDKTCVVVLASNAFEPVLVAAHRRCDVLGQVGVRRWDEQSHVIRVYRVWKKDAVRQTHRATASRMPIAQLEN